MNKDQENSSKKEKIVKSWRFKFSFNIIIIGENLSFRIPSVSWWAED
jgi:hypothetical protein